jgi:hypothetical protein
LPLDQRTTAPPSFEVFEKLSDVIQRLAKGGDRMVTPK